MLEDEKIMCPFCEHELDVRIMRTGKNPTYFVSNECPSCKTPAEKIERFMNNMNKRGRISTEKSYIKTFNKPK